MPSLIIPLPMVWIPCSRSMPIQVNTYLNQLIIIKIKTGPHKGKNAILANVLGSVFKINANSGKYLSCSLRNNALSFYGFKTILDHCLNKRSQKCFGVRSKHLFTTEFQKKIQRGIKVPRYLGLSGQTFLLFLYRSTCGKDIKIRVIFGSIL